MEQSTSSFLQKLEGTLAPLYSSAYTPGHDVEHVRRMIFLGPKIAAATSLSFDQAEFEAAVWLHNLDRMPSTETQPEPYLSESPFSKEARVRIIDAVLQHGKKNDEPGDSALLGALRIADKLDRLGPLGILSATAHRHMLPLYDPQNPFGYDSTTEGKLRSVYNDFCRVLEWVEMLPSDEARSLIDKKSLRAFIDFVRAMGDEIAGRYGLANEVERDIQKALGHYYQEFAL